MEYLAQHIESLIFVAESPINFKEIRSCLTEAFGLKQPKEEVQKAIDSLKAKYAEDQYAFELVEIAEGYQFLTKGSYHQTVGVYLRQTMRRKLSRSALETLSIIAYKQPVTKGDMERVRGVDCNYSVQKLLEKELVSIVGRSEGPGRPLLYGTSAKFMDYFGLKNLEDLPKPKDFKKPESEIGEQAPLHEEVENEVTDEVKTEITTEGENEIKTTVDNEVSTEIENEVESEVENDNHNEEE